ncbi:hypothetical protein BJ508DRAFT_323074 [Ascobolus immersus RN42]|uniref:Uncharacterized protein n=1 Tax=Ascobolus immersus RN42 TaxID=1160509 RepID=A0A3N4IFF4_ASCIM|nr:hypothetical protein BJ508DRAFT_323074 [Ascobolus immersus RN42]
MVDLTGAEEVTVMDIPKCSTGKKPSSNPTKDFSDDQAPGRASNPIDLDPTSFPAVPKGFIFVGPPGSNWPTPPKFRPKIRGTSQKARTLRIPPKTVPPPSLVRSDSSTLSEDSNAVASTKSVSLHTNIGKPSPYCDGNPCTCPNNFDQRLIRQDDWPFVDECVPVPSTSHKVRIGCFRNSNRTRCEHGTIWLAIPECCKEDAGDIISPMVDVIRYDINALPGRNYR